jgi:biopolymer transport protein ExbB
MYELFLNGGFLMYPIAFCSVLALGIFLERLWNLREKKIIPKDYLIEVEDLINRRKIHEAMILCRRDSSSMATIIFEGIRNFNRGREAVKDAVEGIGRQEAAKLERYVGVVGTVAAISPLLGLLGTVTGMIKAFNVISTHGVGNPSSLAGGISEALITTAAGLIVAIPAYVMYRYLMSKVDRIILSMEKYSLHLVDLLEEKNHPTESESYA